MIPRLFRGLCQDAYLGRAQCSTHRGNVSEQQLRPLPQVLAATSYSQNSKQKAISMPSGQEVQEKEQIHTHKLPGKRIGLRYRGSRRHGFQCPQRRQHRNQAPHVCQFGRLKDAAYDVHRCWTLKSRRREKGGGSVRVH